MQQGMKKLAKLYGKKKFGGIEDQQRISEPYIQRALRGKAV